MKRKLHTDLGRAPAYFIEIFCQDLRILGAEVGDSIADPPAQIHLEMLAAEIRNVAGTGGVVLDCRRKPGGIEVLAAAADGTQSNAGRIERLLELFRRLVKVLG